MPAFQPYWGKPAVRNDRGDSGNVGIIRSPLRATVLPDFQERIALRKRHRIGRGSQLQVGPRFRHRQFQGQRPSAGSGPVLGRKLKLAVMAAQVEERIDPGIKVGGATETVAGSARGRDLFSAMVN
jgi:hypothetical protein